MFIVIGHYPNITQLMTLKQDISYIWDDHVSHANMYICVHECVRVRKWVTGGVSEWYRGTVIESYCLEDTVTESGPVAE